MSDAGKARPSQINFRRIGSGRNGTTGTPANFRETPRPQFHAWEGDALAEP